MANMFSSHPFHMYAGISKFLNGVYIYMQKRVAMCLVMSSG